MPLTTGTRLGPYEIVSLLGSGGMGEVYRAHDTKLNRDVALKMLPDAFASDPDRMARFTREAQTLAALNHPNIAHIHGLEESGGVRALVMELVDGEDLAQRLVRGPIPLDEALPIAKQIAEALEAAHEQGIIHRDLKPANIKVRADGTVKVLDFGLAKAMAPVGSAPTLSMSPTITTPAMTHAGMILGTAAYMSPEQARGKAVDKRADIWAFGCVLFEMLSGRPAFAGTDVTTVLAKVLEREPDWSGLPAKTPAAVRTVLHRCIEKDPRRRLRDIGDAWLELTGSVEGSGRAVLAPSPSRRPFAVLTALPWAMLLILAAAGAALWPSKSTLVGPVTRSLLDFPQFALSGARLGNLLVLSPDGTRLVYVGNPDGKNQLYVRRLDQFEATAIPGTEEAMQPFFKPDSTAVGFFARGKLKTVALAGGSPITLADAPVPFGGAWGTDDTIVFAPGPAGLMRVNAGGGAVQRLTQVSECGVLRHSWSTVLPDGKAVLFTVSVTTLQARVDAVSLATGEVKTVVPSGACPQFLDAGHLVYADPSSGALSAVDFDVSRLETRGQPTTMLEGVMASAQASQYSVSRTGSLVYLPNTFVSQRTLVWVDRSGRTSPALPQAQAFASPRISPDGRRVAFLTYEGLNPRDIWVYDLEQGTTERLTQEGQLNNGPEWAPDGKTIAFGSIREASQGRQNIFLSPADGSGSAERLLSSDFAQLPSAWAPRGRVLVYAERHPETQYDLWWVDLDGDRTGRPFISTPGNDLGATFSPDGRYLAYSSDTSGRSEVYAQPFPRPGETKLISTDGGAEPTWSQRGELFYRQGEKMMVVRVTTTPTFSASKPDTLFEGRFEIAILTPGIRMYDVQPDGQRFLMVKSDSPSAPRQLLLITNWTEELKAPVPTK